MLSDAEREKFDQIVSDWKGSRSSTMLRLRMGMAWGFTLLLVGIAGLVGAVAWKTPIMGVAAFLVMLVGVTALIRRRPVSLGHKSSAGESLTARAERRWSHRKDTD